MMMSAGMFRLVFYTMDDQLIQKQAQRIKELEEELRIVRRQLEQFQTRQMEEIGRRRRATIKFYREQYEKEHGSTDG